MSDVTKNKRKWSIILFWTSIVLNILPMIIFVIIGFIEGSSTQKLSLGISGILAVIVGVFGLISKMPIKKTIFWTLAFGAYCVVKEQEYLIITMAVCQMIDECLVSPAHKAFKTSYKTNKEIDKRL